MNTGATMETQRLMLAPSTEEDNEAFLKMLREDGDFTLFCGVEFSETRLMDFCGYFLRENACFFSIFRKADAEREFVGYVGIDWHLNERRYEVEFYVGRQFRGHGYCTEALRKVM